MEEQSKYYNKSYGNKKEPKGSEKSHQLSFFSSRYSRPSFCIVCLLLCCWGGILKLALKLQCVLKRVVQTSLVELMTSQKNNTLLRWEYNDDKVFVFISSISKEINHISLNNMEPSSLYLLLLVRRSKNYCSC